MFTVTTHMLLKLRKGRDLAQSVPAVPHEDFLMSDGQRVSALVFLFGPRA